jgi:hypothetical protein
MNPAETYILDQKEPFRTILLHLQAVIERTLPELDLKFKYRIPFYYYGTTPFCYLNHTKGYVDVGFWHSAHMTVHSDKMVTKDRKIMKSLRYTTLEEIEESILIEVLHNAYSVKEKGFWK